MYKVLEVKQLATNQHLKSSQPHVGPRTRSTTATMPVQQEDADTVAVLENADQFLVEESSDQEVEDSKPQAAVIR